MNLKISVSTKIVWAVFRLFLILLSDLPGTEGLRHLERKEVEFPSTFFGILVGKSLLVVPDVPSPASQARQPRASPGHELVQSEAGRLSVASAPPTYRA